MDATNGSHESAVGLHDVRAEQHQRPNPSATAISPSPR